MQIHYIIRGSTREEERPCNHSVFTMAHTCTCVYNPNDDTSPFIQKN